MLLIIRIIIIIIFLFLSIHIYGQICMDETEREKMHIYISTVHKLLCKKRLLFPPCHVKRNVKAWDLFFFPTINNSISD